MNLPDARALAGTLLEALAPACERIEVAGSVRRGKRVVKDVELVLLPKTERVQLDLFGGEVTRPATDGLLPVLVADGLLALDKVVKRNGEKLKRFVAPRHGGVIVELYIADERNWGNQLAIRTGDAQWNQVLMTPRALGGLMPTAHRQADGYLWSPEGKVIPCPEESDWFGALGIREVPAPASRCYALARRLAGGRPPGGAVGLVSGGAA